MGHIKNQRHHFADKAPCNQSYDISSSHVWIWELDHKEGWALKDWCFQVVVLEKTVESPFDSKEIKPVNPKENQPWIFSGRIDAEAPILWPPDAKSWLIGKDCDDGKDWGQEVNKLSRTQYIMRWLDSFNDSVAMRLSKFWKIVKDMKASEAAVHGFRRVRYKLMTEKQQQHEAAFYRNILSVFLITSKETPSYLWNRKVKWDYQLITSTE